MGQPVMFIKGPSEPLMIERAEGPWLYTRDGRKILAAEEVARLNYILPVWSSPARERLTERLAGWTPPGLNRFFFTSGGSEAVEAAIKFAIMYQKTKGRPRKRKIVSRWFSYHGNTLGALSVGGNL